MIPARNDYFLLLKEEGGGKEIKTEILWWPKFDFLILLMPNQSMTISAKLPAFVHYFKM